MIKEEGQDLESYRDEYNWPLCTSGESHQISKLLLAQIIPKDELVDLAHKLHKVRNQLGLNQFCHPMKEEFADAYSLQKIAYNRERVSQILKFCAKLTKYSL